MKILNYNKELKNFYLFIMGQFISQSGSKLTSYGLVLWVYKQSGSVLSASLLTVCYIFPEVLLSFIAGSLSDRWNKKKIMLIADSLGAMASVGVILLLLSDNLIIEYLYIINIMLGITDAFQIPASEVTISAIVSKENYMKTSGVRSFCNSFISIFAPVIATSVYAFFGLKAIVLADLITFCIAFLTLLLLVDIPKLPIVRGKEEKLLKSCKFGLQYLMDRKDILSLIMFMAFVNFIAAIYNTNLAPMVLSRNGNNDVQLGIVSGTIGIAGLLGSLLVTKVQNKQKKIPMILNIMSFSFLICNGILGIGRNYLIWIMAVFMGNILIPILTANVDYIMRTKIPISMQGRVFSARNTLQYTSIPIGTLCGGVLADQVFEPFMKSHSLGQSISIKIVGTGIGSGIALLYLVIGIIGFLGCCLFRMNKKMQL